MLAEGTPDEIQRNQAVQDAYLGGLREHELAGA
jgi:ABC-type branched-subunit amino acid transport system ATPase component